MIWTIFWIVAMVGLVGAVAVAAFREKSAQAKARKALGPEPQPLDMGDGLSDQGTDGFGEPDPLDSFGTEGAQGDFAPLDENAFK